MEEILSVFVKLMRLEGLAKTTINTYHQHILDYFKTFSKDIIIKDVAEYLNLKKIKVDNRKLSRSHYNQIQYAFKKYWEIFYNKPFPLLNPVKVPLQPPKIINKEDMISGILSEPNRRNRIILSLANGSMLRHAEIWTLNIYEDIDLHNKKVYIRAGKGFKPRITILTEYCKQEIEKEIIERKLRKINNPYVCAVEGSQTKYICYNDIGKIIKNAGIRIGCNNWHTHLLRHTGSTHLDEAGISVRKNQILLGHSRLNTTQGYIHPTIDKVLEVENPLDKILIKVNQSLQQNNKSINNG